MESKSSHKTTTKIELFESFKIKNEIKNLFCFFLFLTTPVIFGLVGDTTTLKSPTSK